MKKSIVLFTVFLIVLAVAVMTDSSSNKDVVSTLAADIEGSGSLTSSELALEQGINNNNR